MAARKKAQAKRRKAPAPKPAARKKNARSGAKPARKAPPRRTRPQARTPAPAKPAAPLAPPAPPGERIGIVTHYFSHIAVAVLKLDPGARLRVGDNIRIQGHTAISASASNPCRSTMRRFRKSAGRTISD